MRTPARTLQRGMTTVEMAISGVAFMTILFGAIEVSRLLYTWNALDTITQRAARVAAICTVDSGNVHRFAQFSEPGETGTIVPGLEDANLSIQYFNEFFGAPDPGVQPAFVRAEIVDYEHRLLVPFVPSTLLPSPAFSTTLPAESMGYTPDPASPGGFTYSC